jgi:Ca-activated chloride channel homolog
MKASFLITLLLVAISISCSKALKRAEQPVRQQPQGTTAEQTGETATDSEYYAEDSTEAEVTPAAPQSALQAKGRFGFAQKKEAEAIHNRPTHLGDQVANSESYKRFSDNKFQTVQNEPLSTFSIDVDTASYANTRRMIYQGAVPPKDAVRIEEFINYFPYQYKGPSGDEPIAVHMDAFSAPWNPKNHLVRVALQGKELKKSDLRPSNLVFLIDVSGSMSDENKLPLLKEAFRKLVENLDGRDKVSIVVYAGASGLVLEPTSADNKTKILNAIDQLTPGGSTNGADGIELAYQLAQRSFIREGNNRVLLATDGDFNVGLSDEESLSQLIKRKADGGVFLSVLGFGMGNYKDSNMERLSKDGNGNYFYIDSTREAEKVLVTQLSSTLFTIAKDVKIQVEFNPAYIESYRLIGYENRVMENQDFDDDRKDAGEIGAGFSVTALYEVIPTGNSSLAVQKLKYSQPPKSKYGTQSGELFTAKLRYKKPHDSRSQLKEVPFTGLVRSMESAPDDMRFISAVAEFGMILRNSPHRGEANLKSVFNRAQSAIGHDDGGYRREFIQLVRKVMDRGQISLAEVEND